MLILDVQKRNWKKQKTDFFQKLLKMKNFRIQNLKLTGFTFYINGEEAGYAINLSTSQNKKSVNYVDLKNVIFDEFIIEERTEKILFAQRSIYIFKFTRKFRTFRRFTRFLTSKCRNYYKSVFFVF